MYQRRELLLGGVTGALALAAACATTRHTRDTVVATPRNIGYVLMDLEAEVGFSAPKESYGKLADLFAESKSRITKDTAPVPTLQNIDAILNRYFTHSTTADTSLLGESLSKGRCDIDCDITSNLYLAIGEELGLPLKAVIAPEHVFVRWEHPDGNYLDWETTDGIFTTDEYYTTKFNITPQSRTAGVFLQSLTRIELIGKHYGNVGTELLLKEKYQQAIVLLDKALQLNSQDVESMSNKGVALECLGHLPEALHNYRKALLLYPSSSRIHANMGNCLKKMGKAAEGDNHLRRAEELKKKQ